MATKTTAKTTKENMVEVQNKDQFFSAAAAVVVGRDSCDEIVQGTGREFDGNSIADLQKKVVNAFNKGILDTEKRIVKPFAAGYVFTTITIVTIDGKKYVNHEVKNYVFGDKDLFQEYVNNNQIMDENPDVDTVYIEM